MPSPLETRAALNLLTSEASAIAAQALAATSGSPEARRLALLNDVPEIIGYYADGSAALAADFYDDTRSLAGVRAPFVTELVIAERVVKIRRAIVWAADPLFEGATDQTLARLMEVVQPEVARPFRDTITGNRQRDSEADGWRRITVGGCKFCRMLASNGAVYRKETVRFAAHPNCHCTAEPVFAGQGSGQEASVMQYMASKRNRTPEQRAQLREYLDTHFGDGTSSSVARGPAVQQVKPDQELIARGKELNRLAQEAHRRGDDVERLRLQAQASALFRKAHGTLI